MDVLYDILLRFAKAEGPGGLRAVGLSEVDTIYGDDVWEEVLDNWEKVGVVERVEVVRFVSEATAGAGGG
eukprot:9179766-Lingulodinium_polyedra.AAC.1